MQSLLKKRQGHKMLGIFYLYARNAIFTFTLIVTPNCQKHTHKNNFYVKIVKKTSMMTQNAFFVPWKEVMFSRSTHLKNELSIVFNICNTAVTKS